MVFVPFSRGGSIKFQNIGQKIVFSVCGSNSGNRLNTSYRKISFTTKHRFEPETCPNAPARSEVGHKCAEGFGL